MAELEAEMRQHYGTQVMHSFQLENYQASPAEDADQARHALSGSQDTYSSEVSSDSEVETEERMEVAGEYVHGDKLLFPPTSPGQPTTGFPFTSPLSSKRSVATYFPLHSPQLAPSSSPTPSRSFYDVSQPVSPHLNSVSPLASSTPLPNILRNHSPQDPASLLRPTDLPLHHELSTLLSAASSGPMSTFTPEQFSALLLTISRLAEG